MASGTGRAAHRRSVGFRLLAALSLACACAQGPEGPGRRAMALEDLAAIEAAVRAYAADHGGGLPPTLDPLIRPQPDGKHYLPSGTPAIHDPWGRRYQYLLGEGPEGFRIVTLGRDGAPGGSGDDADLDQSAVAGG